MPALPLAGSNARSDTSHVRDTVPWIATPASLRSRSSSASWRGQARALEESAPGSRDRPHRLRREEPPLPDTVGLLMGDAASPMGFARPLKSRLDPGCPLLWVSTDKHVPFLEASGASHGGVQEAQMPQRHPASVEIKDGIAKVPRVSEDHSDGHVLSCAPRREPGPHKEPHGAPGSHEVPESLALNVVPFSPREHDLN